MITELQEEWLHPGIVTDLLWDYKICEPSDKKTLLQEILFKAYETKLNESESEVMDGAHTLGLFIVVTCVCVCVIESSSARS